MGKLVLGTTANYSFIYAHTSNVKHLARTNPVRLELNVACQTTGQREWEQAYRLPRYGLAISYIDLRDREYLGEVYSAIAYMETINRRKGAFHFSFRVGTGVAYCTRPFDFEANRKNQFFSLPVSPAMQGVVNFDFTISPQLEWHNGLAITHYSNGAIRLPNKGINMLGIETGIAFIPSGLSGYSPFEGRKWEAEKRWDYHARLGVAVKQVTVTGDRYCLQVLGLNAVYRANLKSGLTVGLEFQNNPALMEEKLNNQPYATVRGKDIYRVTVPVGHELYVGRVVMVNQVGVYLYTPEKTPLPIYLNNGLRVHLSDRFWLSTLLRTHGGVAEFIEFGFGVKLR